MTLSWEYFFFLMILAVIVAYIPKHLKWVIEQLKREFDD